MKILFHFRFFLSLICLSAFASTTVAQEKQRALKFDEFHDVVENQFYSDRDELSFRQRIERFSKQLEKERGVKAYVIYYKARISNSDVSRDFINQINGIKYRIQNLDEIKVEETVIAEGGYRERNTVEFWIVPKNAEPPAPTPTLEKSETFVCRNINVYSDVPLSEAETINFSVSTYNFEGIDNYSLTWKVSAGEIVRGQGTNEIKVKLNNSSVKRITAFVEVSGLPYPCQKVFSATGEPQGKLHLTDSFGPIPNGETRSRLDSFLVTLQNNPTAKGYIIVYGNRAEGNRDAERRITLYKNHFTFRNFDVSRIDIVRCGFREEISSELWLYFDDAEKPVPTPTVDEKFVVVPKPARKPRPRRK